MVSKTFSVALLGLEGTLIDVEADISAGLPGFLIIGLPDTALSNAKERVRTASKNAGCAISTRKITVNLSPAALPKQGSDFDLAIAMALLAADRRISADSVESFVHLGELGLDGRLRPAVGILPAVVAASRLGKTKFMVPAGNADEASLVPGITVVGVNSLRDAAIFHGAELDPIPTEAVLAPSRAVTAEPAIELAEVIGNRDAVQSLVVAAAGGHHLFMLGPPGAGKTMLAMRLPGILPPLGTAASLEVSSLRSLAGERVGTELITQAPFEAPHHTATQAALIGGGTKLIRPGAAARASHGILFLDEAPEFSRVVLDSLRQPLESGTIVIHRANQIARFPGSFQLVMAANPCPCGQYGAPDSECTCAPMARRRYLGRLSGPLLDRIDLQLRVRRITAAELKTADRATALTSEKARAAVLRARANAAERLATTPWSMNSHVPGDWLRTGPRKLPAAATVALDRALERGILTMRGYDRVLRVAWTVSDLAGANSPAQEHVERALYLRKSLVS